jgi:hypothetical protein
MTNITLFTEPHAKALEKLSEFGTTAINSATELSHYAGRILGTAPEDVVGLLIGDPLRAVRTVIAAKLDDLVAQKLQQRNVQSTQPVSPSLAIPLMRAAYDESRPELQELWANLIASAMDPIRSSRVRISFIETLKRLDPLDALVLKTLFETSGVLRPNARDYLASLLKVTPEEVIISSINLQENKCVVPRMSNTSIEYHDFQITTYGRQLIIACKD